MERNHFVKGRGQFLDESESIVAEFSDELDTTFVKHQKCKFITLVERQVEVLKNQIEHPKPQTRKQESPKERQGRFDRSQAPSPCSSRPGFCSLDESPTFKPQACSRSKSKIGIFPLSSESEKECNTSNRQTRRKLQFPKEEPSTCTFTDKTANIPCKPAPSSAGEANSTSIGPCKIAPRKPRCQLNGTAPVQRPRFRRIFMFLFLLVFLVVLILGTLWLNRGFFSQKASSSSGCSNGGTVRYVPY